MLTRKYNLVHVLPSLRKGGAEISTVILLMALNKDVFNCFLITFFTPKANNHLLKEFSKLKVHFSPATNKKQISEEYENLYKRYLHSR